jgi:hypothetical protein
MQSIYTGIYACMAVFIHGDALPETRWCSCFVAWARRGPDDYGDEHNGMDDFRRTPSISKYKMF